MELTITSSQNEKVKWLKQLHDSTKRRRLGLFVVEGTKEIGVALQAGLKPHSLFVKDGQPVNLNSSLAACPCYNLSSAVFGKVAYRRTSVQLAVFYYPHSNLGDLTLSTNPLVIVVEAVEKPGNLGAILRVADGAGVDAVIVVDPAVDIYNPNVIRSSVGCVFTKQVVAADNQEVLDFCKASGLAVYAACLEPAAKAYTKVDFSQPTALVLGTESTGLSDFWLQHGQPVYIPMLGKNDSLNVSVAAAVLAYEVNRQRHAA